jgi:transcriptional regulator with XRE-family HTH domain
MDDTSHMMHDARQKVMNAVRSLRLALRLNQTDFGRRLGKSLPTIQRWETVLPPSGEALVQLMKLALVNKQVDMAEVFEHAISEELGHQVPRFEILPDEQPVIEAIISIWRIPGYEKEREQVERIIRPVTARHANSDATAAALFGLTNEVRRRITAGESDDDIVRGLAAWQPAIVKMLAENLRELDRLSAASRKGEK